VDGDLAVGLLWFIAFLFSTTVHEAMHALVAWKGGDPTAYHRGQVSLSPIPHIKREPIGMLAVPLLTSLTQGWAMGWGIFLPEEHAQRLRQIQASGFVSMAGLLIAWQVFPAITHPLFSLMLKLVHPDESYSTFG
jgi:hypothetical protein